MSQGPPPPNPMMVERFQSVVSSLFQQVGSLQMYTVPLHGSSYQRTCTCCDRASCLLVVRMHEFLLTVFSLLSASTCLVVHSPFTHLRAISREDSAHISHILHSSVCLHSFACAVQRIVRLFSRTLHSSACRHACVPSCLRAFMPSLTRLGCAEDSVHVL